MTAEPSPDDPKGLIRESFRIPGISLGECRTIFLDWALSLPAGVAPDAAAQVLIATYAPGAEGHPMLSVLREAAARQPAVPRRRGGWRGRARPEEG